ncbi:hypothetical protein [Mesorhizobium sp. M2E.F.Ca.ET.166.01.1.1]|uniref:hypothetical protein n=1 Tax=Mesorhizobium sp. M2E.F.Ca.ET.166.01.1.1 TaxID=2500523 RepID=UPI000FE0FE51|nr:hypothetical protein [Mesorhizobium sp. M2E.F.Ca.ET.166.01.1.1]TGT68307.1 hypothetical protein EN809_027835 [Mesorhizobium sp. M2E.F.Ca.ET.166.01.1.1]
MMGAAVACPTYLSSDDLDMLTRIFANHCQAFRIPAGPEQDDVARLIMLLFISGIDDADDMKAALAASRPVH